MRRANICVGWLVYLLLSLGQCLYLFISFSNIPYTFKVAQHALVLPGPLFVYFTEDLGLSNVEFGLLFTVVLGSSALTPVLSIWYYLNVYNLFQIIGTSRKMELEIFQLKLCGWDLLSKCAWLSIVYIRKAFRTINGEEKIFFINIFFFHFEKISTFLKLTRLL